MALKDIRFVWATPPRSGGRWRLGLFNFQPLRDPDRPLPAGGVPDYWKKYLHHVLHVSLRGLAGWSVALAVAGYFTGAGVLYLRYDEANSYNRVTYLDLILPNRWEHLPRLKGEALILLAREKLQEGRTDEAFGLLGQGVEKNPTDFTARLDLARIYISSRLRPQGVKLLRAGLDLGYPGRDYLTAVFALAADGDQPDVWVELCRLARTRLDEQAEPDRPAGDAAWLDQQLAKAHLANGQADEALALVAERYPETDAFRREITILALLDRKDAAAACATAAAWAAEQPANPVPLRLLTRARREAGDFNGMDEALARLRELDPVKPDALLYALVQNQLANRPAEAKTALDALLFRHGANEKLYPTLTAALAEVKLVGAFPSLINELKERGLSLRPALMAQLQADIAARAWPAALDTADALRATPGPALDQTQSDWLETMIRLARACADAGSGNQSSLVEIVADHPGALRLYRLLLDALLDAGRLDTAASILALAEGPYPSARCIVAARAEIAARRSALGASAAPAASKNDDPLVSLETFTAIFSRNIREGNAPAALALLVTARRAQPAWLVGSEPRLDALELPLRARGDDPLRLQLLARNALGRDDEAPKNLLELARAIHDEGLTDNAELLAREVLRHRPDDQDALKLLTGWRKPGVGASSPPSPAP